jgi:L-2,4-diaminobutyrate transaminase
VEFVASRSPLRAFDRDQRFAARVTAASRAAGVLTRALPASDTIAFSPPLIVTDSEIDEMVDVTRRALDDVTAELGRD